MEGYNVGKALESAEFRVKEETFRIVVYPNGQTEEFREYLSVVLQNCGEEEVKITVGSVTRQAKNITLGDGYGYDKG